MGLVYIINQLTFDCRARGPRFKANPFKFLLIFNANKKKIDRNINKNPCKNHNNCSREQRTILFYYYL